jgi:hypothetical protein
MIEIFAFSNRSASSREEGAIHAEPSALGCRASTEHRRRMLGLFLRGGRSDDKLEQILGSGSEDYPA